MCILLLLILAPGSAAGQSNIFDLATNGDGSIAFFSTALARKDSSDTTQAVYPPNLRIYRVDPAGVQLYLQRPRVDPPPNTPMGQFSLSNYYSLSRPETNRDGTVIAFTGQCQCVGGAHCLNAPLWQTTVAGTTAGSLEAPGKGRLSGSGRYLLVYGANTTPGFYASIMDLQTGQTFERAPYTPYGNVGTGRVVADDGTVVFIDSTLTLLSPTTVKRIPLAYGSPGEAVIDSAARIVVYSVRGGGGSLPSIHIYLIAEGQDKVLAAFPNADSYAPYLTADGRRVMFLSGTSGAPQIYTIGTDGSELRQVTHEASGVTLAAMSDDGKVAWYFSGESRLFQMNLDTGDVKQRMGATPQIGEPFPIAPGSTYSLSGTGFSDESFAAESYPLPRSLGGVSVSVNGVFAPIYSVAPRQIVFQTPWDTDQTATVEVHTNSTSPFAPQLRFLTTAPRSLAAFLPLAGSLEAAGLLAVHQNWEALVAASLPARPGEILHLYGTGFGSVDRTPADGTPAPADPPARTVAPITCSVLGADSVTQLEVPVLFAGLAPGLVGYYQMDIRLPASNLSASTQLNCKGEGTTATFGGRLR